MRSALSSSLIATSGTPGGEAHSTEPYGNTISPKLIIGSISAVTVVSDDVTESQQLGAPPAMLFERSSRIRMSGGCPATGKPTSSHPVSVSESASVSASVSPSTSVSTSVSASVSASVSPSASPSTPSPGLWAPSQAASPPHRSNAARMIVAEIFIVSPFLQPSSL